MYNLLNFPNIFLILIHVLQIISPTEWFKECSMNYVVSSCALRNLKLVNMGPNSFYNLVSFKPFACQGLIIPSLHLEIWSINHNPLLNIEVPGFLNMNGTSFVVDSFEDVMDMVVHSSHSYKLFFCSGGGEFVVVGEVYGTWIKAIETSVWREFVGSGGYGVVSKFCER